jgi:hypothetical protein
LSSLFATEKKKVKAEGKVLSPSFFVPRLPQGGLEFHQNHFCSSRCTSVHVREDRGEGEGVGRVVESGIHHDTRKKIVPEFRHNFPPRPVYFIKNLMRELTRGIHKYNCGILTRDRKLKLEDLTNSLSDAG